MSTRDTPSGMGDDDIHAFTPPLRPLAAVQAPRRRWPWVLLAVVAVLSLLALAGAASLIDLLDAGAREGLNVTINGERWPLFHADGDMDLAGVAGVAVALMVAVVVVPVVVLLALLAVVATVGVAVLIALGTAALALACVLGVGVLVLSPLWGVALLLWLLLRRPASRQSGPSAAAA
jgi:hypothetical protein